MIILIKAKMININTFNVRIYDTKVRKSDIFIYEKNYFNHRKKKIIFIKLR